MISGIVEKTIARRKPSPCKMRSKRSSKLTPHSSIKAPGASAIKIGTMFSIVREINGGAARCQLGQPRRFYVVELLELHACSKPNGGSTIAHRRGENCRQIQRQLQRASKINRPYLDATARALRLIAQ